ncbi:hypothetical protein ACIFOE_23465 [Paenibacillus sp. NRS-1783]|uniref:hypothetical protein n=1 Tax=Paenibacillus sp. NRS-1783 TaxID=3233907 RepID=UPI003D2CA941
MSVKDLTDKQLNRALAELMGYTVEIGPVTRLWRLMKDGKIKATSGESEELMWSYTPDYCADPAASLEVQAKAIEVDSESYIKNLFGTVISPDFICLEYDQIASLLSASPRERAEAAYMTLSSQD